LPKTKEILESGLPYKISTQKLNKHIKTICKEAGVDDMILGNKVNSTTKRNVKKLRPKYEYIGTHTGRRTFATLHYNKIPTSVIMKVTGHSRESNLITYINQSTDEHLDVFNDYYK
jgi:integrase